MNTLISINNKNKFRSYLEQYVPAIILAICLISLLLLPFKPNITSKLFNFAGIVSIVVVLFSFKKYIKSSSVIIAIPLLMIGVTELLWVEAYKTADTIYRSVYHGHFQMGKIALFGCFILLILSGYKNNKITRRLHFFISISISLLIFGYAIYQVYYQHIPRAELAFSNASNATGAAYAMVFIALYTQAAILQSTIRLKYFLYTLFVLIGFVSIILTQTRGGILSYPFIVLITFALYLYSIKKLKLKMLLFPVILFAVCIFIFKDNITQRVIQASNEVTAYLEKSQISSVGDRLSMLKAGFTVSNNNFTWQSAEERNTKIAQLAKEDASFKGATRFMNAHLHNDLIEALSTKGWITGVLLTVLFYLSILIYAFKNKNVFVFSVTLSLTTLGLSDTLIYATQVPLAWILCFILIIHLTICMNNTKD